MTTYTVVVDVLNVVGGEDHERAFKQRLARQFTDTSTLAEVADFVRHAGYPWDVLNVQVVPPESWRAMWL